MNFWEHLGMPPPRDTEHLKVLDRLVGPFRSESVERQANGDEKKSTGTSVTKWSLQGRYVESRGTDSDGKQESLGLWTYDSDAGVYKAWYFLPISPKPIPLTFRWNESTKTFTGKGDFGNGITVQTTIRFIDNDRSEWTATIKDASGNVVGEVKGKSFRT